VADATFVLFGSLPAAMAKGHIDWDTNAIKCALLLDTWTPDQDTEDEWSDISTHEHSHAGDYPEGGEELTTKTATYVEATNITTFDADDVLFNYTTTAHYAVIYDSVTGYLIGYIDFGLNITGDPSTTIKFPTAGLFSASV